MKNVVEIIKNVNTLIKRHPYKVIGNLRDKQQREGQSMLEFVSQMQCLANKIPNALSDSELLEIDKHNMLPCYQPALVYGSVDSFTDLLRIAKRIESFFPSTQSKVFVPLRPVVDRYVNNNNNNVNRNNFVHRAPALPVRRPPAICASNTVASVAVTGTLF